MDDLPPSLADVSELLTELAPRIVWLARADGYTVYCNPFWHDYTGLSPQQTYGDGWLSAIHPEDRERVGARWQSIVEAAADWEEEMRFRHGASGEYRWHLNRGRPIFDTAGKLDRWIGVAVDIDRLKQTERSLRASEEQFRLLVDGVRDRAIYRLDPAGKVVTWNAAAEQMTGYPAEEIVGRHIACLYSLEDQAARQPQRDLAQALAEGRCESEGWRYRRNGTRFWGATIISPLFDEQRGFRGYGTVTRDTTASRRTQESLRQGLLEAPQTTLTRFADVRKGGGFEYVGGIMPIACFPQAYRVGIEIAERHGTTYSTGARIIGTGQELEARRRDGTLVPIQLNVTEFNLDGERQFIGLVRDISRRKRAEDELRALNAELEQRVAHRTSDLAAANRELEAFSYSVSHDLRAPLRAIAGFSQILAEDHSAELSAEALRLLGIVRSNVGRMGQLIDDLLTYSRCSRQPLQARRVDMQALVAQLVEELQPHGEERELEFRIDALPPCVGDAALLRQVWHNLLANAVKFTRGRTPAIIEIGARLESSQPQRYTYWIRDNGVGFDMRYAGKLFGVFQRLHSQTEFEGTGVGLAIVQNVVQRHGGTVRAEARPGAGAEFQVTLPTARQLPTERQPPSET
ncbi:MAG: PAS domain S-box protein [Pirellulaceae bacterium]|nr:PAS domain S-box protein [Pirellulaceae bacterium]